MAFERKGKAKSEHASQLTTTEAKMDAKQEVNGVFNVDKNNVITNG